MSKFESSKKTVPFWVIILVALVFVFSLWSANIFLLIDGKESGISGDIFLSLISLFSGLAFVGLIVIVYLQKKELQLQREEFDLTQKALKTQNVILQFQGFEKTFFKMISLHHEILNSIHWTVEEYERESRMNTLLASSSRGRKIVKELMGREVFEKHYSGLRSQLQGLIAPSEIDSSYILEYGKYKNDFDPYFRNLYKIIVLIDSTQLTNDEECELEFEEKYKYASIFRDQLSAYELLWLFYNCLSQNGQKGLKPLVEKYTLLKHINLEKVANKDHFYLFKRSAFLH